MRFYDKEVNAGIMLADGRYYQAKANVDFIISFEMRQYGIKDTYFRVQEMSVYWTDVDDNDVEVDFELEFLSYSDVKLMLNGKVIWSDDDMLKWEHETNLDTTGSGALLINEIEIDLHRKQITVTL